MNDLEPVHYLQKDNVKVVCDTTRNVDQSSPWASDSTRWHPSFHAYARNETDSIATVSDISKQDDWILGIVIPGLSQ